MSSQRKLDSARRNGALSKGPVTEAGKRASSQNGIRHGILTQTVVLEGESKDRFEELHAALIAEFQPRTTTEAALVETMAIARWRHLRVLAIQKAGFDLEMAKQQSGVSPAYRAALVFKNLADSSRLLDLLSRYEISFDRQFSRALSLLLKLRAQSPQPAEPLPSTLSALTCATFDENSIFPSEPNPKIEHPGGAGLSLQPGLQPRSEHQHGGAGLSLQHGLQPRSPAEHEDVEHEHGVAGSGAQRPASEPATGLRAPLTAEAERKQSISTP